MDYQQGAQSRKRKRRRGLDRPSVKAQLVVDARLKGEAGFLSAGLFSELFSALAPQLDHQQDSTPAQYHIAISPNILPGHRQPDLEVPWTILPVKAQSPSSDEQEEVRPVLRVPRSSSALKSFGHIYQTLASSSGQVVPRSTIEVKILDVVPVKLKTVVVSIDEEALNKLEVANQRYRQGQAVNGTASGSLNARLHASQRPDFVGSTILQSDRWEGAIRSAMRDLHIIHSGDSLPLPLSSHPITHVPPPPAIVHNCEPVSQGVVAPETRIIVIPLTNSSKPTRSSVASPTLSTMNGTLTEEDETDTANEQFYSAAEDPSKPPAGQGSRSNALDLDTDDSAASHGDDTDMSDNEGGTLGLSLPSLPTQPSGTLSVFSSATPRPGNPFMDGTASPGSVVSGYSMSTVVGGSARGKLFEAQGLLSHISEDLLHPKPPLDEDDEARAFVDSSLLAKLGCFSGDWIRVEATTEDTLATLGSWGIGGLDKDGGRLPDWRTLKLYALPGQSAKRPRYALNRGMSQRHSQPLMAFDRSPPKIHLSPIVLASLGEPTRVRVVKLELSPARRQSRLGAPPPKPPPLPVATEFVIHPYVTPLNHERVFASSTNWALENYFKHKRRVVKNGDLLAISFSALTGRAISQSKGEDDPAQKELLVELDRSAPKAQDSTQKHVVWYKVSGVHADVDNVESPWGALALVKHGETRLSQGADVHGKLPETTKSSWQYYLGIRRLPPTAIEKPLDLTQPLSSLRSYVSPLRRRLRELMSAATSPHAIHNLMPPIAILLTSTQRHIGKTTVAQESCADLGLHCAPIDCHDIVSESATGGGDKNSAAFFEARLERRLLSGSENTSLLLQHLEVFSSEMMTACVRSAIEKSRILVATTTKVDKLPDAMRNLFTHEMEMSAPDEAEREGILTSVVQGSGLLLSPEIDLSNVALKTAALVAGDLVDVVNRATVARQDRLEKFAAESNDDSEQTWTMPTVKDLLVAGGNVTRHIIQADFDVAVDAARKNFADAIGAPKIPNVSWADVGGLNNVKDAVMETIQLPLERPELFAKGMKKRSGILFYGPPGTGKTLLAKAIATEFSLNFFSIKGPELLNMYIGESEANVRRVFQRARDARPCVVFFDELDSVAPKRGNQGDSGGVMDRIVSQLLAELDGMSAGDDGSGGGVFVIGATNRPDLLDQALLRPGRFDKMLYLGVSDTNEKQLTILEALTRKFTLSPTLSLPHIAASLPFTYTGADLYALSSDAMLKAITRRADAVNAKLHAINTKRASFVSRSSRSSSHSTQGGAGSGPPHHQKPPAVVTVAQFFDHYASKEDVEVVVEERDFFAARDELIPSVSQKELEHYDRVRRAFETVDGKADGAKQKRKEKDGHPNANGHGLPPRASIFEAPEDPLNGETTGAEDDDEDFVLRTGNMRLSDLSENVVGHIGNGKARGGIGSAKQIERSSSGVDKGKGKARVTPIRSDSTGFDFGFGNVEDSDEVDLYG